MATVFDNTYNPYGQRPVKSSVPIYETGTSQDNVVGAPVNGGNSGNTGNSGNPGVTGNGVNTGVTGNSGVSGNASGGVQSSVSGGSTYGVHRMGSFVKDPSKPDGGFLDYLGRMYSTPEDMEKLRKSSRTRAMINAIGEMGRHFANLVYTTNGAVPQQISPVTQEEVQRYERERARRDGYNNLYWQQKDKQDALIREQNWKQLQYGLQLAREDRMRQKDENSRDAQIARNAYYDALANKNDEMAAYYKTKAECLEAGFSTDQALKEARIAQAKAQAARANRAGGSGGRGGRSSRGGKGSDGKYHLQVGDKTYTYSSKSDYDAAVDYYAKEYGIDFNEQYEKPSPYGGPSETVQRKKAISTKAAEVKKRSQPKRTQQTQQQSSSSGSLQGNFKGFSIHSGKK